MSLSDRSPSARLMHSLPGRVLLVVFTAAVGAAVLSFLFVLNRWVSPSILRIAILVALGLGVGFASRLLLPSRTRLLRFLSVALALLAALALSHPITLGYLGLSLFRNNPSGPDWQGLGETALALLAALPVVLVQRRVVRTNTMAPPPSLSTSGQPRPRVKTGASRLRVTPRSPFASWRKQLARRPKVDLDRVQTSFTGLLSNARSWFLGLLPAPHTRIRRPGKSTRKIRPLGLRRRSAIHLSSVEEHRCPYCLEAVNRNDPRGVKVCPVCKTQHHADCWEVTGSCQVAHYES